MAKLKARIEDQATMSRKCKTLLENCPESLRERLEERSKKLAAESVELVTELREVSLPILSDSGCQ